MIENKICALTFRLIALSFIILSIIACILNNEIATDYRIFFYYTTQSNFLVLGLFIFLIFKNSADILKMGIQGKSSYAPRIHTSIDIAIFFTFIIYWTLVAPSKNIMYDRFSFANISVHVINPLLSIIDNILFIERGKLKKYDMCFFVIIPIVYYVQTVILALNSFVFSIKNNVISYFPYAFLNFYKYKAITFLIVFALLLFYIAISALMIKMDNKIAKKIQNS